MFMSRLGGRKALVALSGIQNHSLTPKGNHERLYTKSHDYWKLVNE